MRGIRAWNRQRIAELRLDPREKELVELLSFVGESGCSEHDVHGSIKIGMLTILPEDTVLKELYKNLFVSFRGLKYGWSLLVMTVEQMVGLISFDDRAHNKDSVYQLWVLLGVENKIACFFSEFNPHYRNGRLYVSRAAQTEPEFAEQLTAAMFGVLALTNFSSTRWGKASKSSRPVVGGMLLGLNQWVQFAIQHIHGSEYHLGDYQLTDASRRFFKIKMLFLISVFN